MHPASFTLRVIDLFRKYGFGDGDMLDEVLWENGFRGVRTARLYASFEHMVLHELVKRYVVPALPVPLNTECLRGTIHNPVRVDLGDADADDSLSNPIAEQIAGIEVEIGAQDVLNIAQEVLRELQDKGAVKKLRVRVINGPLKGARIEVSGIRPTPMLHCQVSVRSASDLPVDSGVTMPPDAIATSITYYTHPVCNSFGDVAEWVASESKTPPTPEQLA